MTADCSIIIFETYKYNNYDMKAVQLISGLLSTIIPFMFSLNVVEKEMKIKYLLCI